jgi:hypothetical protein
MRYNKKIRNMILNSIESDHILQSYDCFKAEMGWNIPRQGEFKTCVDWFQGLCSECTVLFYHNEIMEYLGCTLEWSQERYWDTVADQFLKMVNNSYPITIGKVINVTYFDTSYMGNSRYNLELDNGDIVRTEVNSSLGYSATNYRNKTVLIEYNHKNTIKSIEVVG